MEIDWDIFRIIDFKYPDDHTFLHPILIDGIRTWCRLNFGQYKLIIYALQSGANKGEINLLLQDIFLPLHSPEFLCKRAEMLKELNSEVER